MKNTFKNPYTLVFRVDFISFNHNLILHILVYEPYNRPTRADLYKMLSVCPQTIAVTKDVIHVKLEGVFFSMKTLLRSD